MSDGQVAAFRLARHRLLARSSARYLSDVAGAIGGAQAQVLSAAALSLAARTEGLHQGGLETAVFRRRSLVMAWCMRSTLHALPSEEVELFVRGTTGRLLREIRWFRGKGHSIRELERLLDEALAALDEPTTIEELARRIARSRGGSVERLPGGGWGGRSRVPVVRLGRLPVPLSYLLRLAGLRGIVCRGPPVEGRPTFVRAERWVSGSEAMGREVAEERLLARYLAAYGPAAPRDFARWTGLRLQDSRAIWARCEDAITEVTMSGRAVGILRTDLDALLGCRLESPVVRLLPHFDAYVLGHWDHDHLLPEQHRTTIYRPQGWVVPTVLVDGEIAGTWIGRPAGPRFKLQVVALRPGLRARRSDLAAEGNRFARFFGARGADVSFVPSNGTTPGSRSTDSD